MDIDFSGLRFFDPKKPEDQLSLANRIAAIRYGDSHLDSPPVMHEDKTKIHIHPSSNSHWLVLPGQLGLDKKTWRLVARYDDEATLEAIVHILRNC